MLDINRVLKEDRLLRALTGLNRKAFDELLEAFSVVRLVGLNKTAEK